MAHDPHCNCSDKFRREHTASLNDLLFTRRQFLCRTGMGMGALTLASVFGLNLSAPAWGADSVDTGYAFSPLAPKAPPLPAKAKAVIHIFASGGPSHVDTFDPKPALAQYADKSLPGTDNIAFPSPFNFVRCGDSGIEVSEVFPRLGACVDDMAIIRSMWTDIPAHEVAQRFMHTGSLQIPKPSLGSWTLYGLGSENQNMPGFVAMGGSPEWRASSFLPGCYQGCEVDYSMNMPLDQVLFNIHNNFIGSDQQRAQLDLAKTLDRLQAQAVQEDPQMEARIQSFELAFKMQTEATDAFDISKEGATTRQMYGETDMGAKLLIARRLVERGVRFVQIDAGGWDHHTNIAKQLPIQAKQIDQPAAALLTDLKQRGLLDSTLVIWGGEFGRTIGQDRHLMGSPGRDHNGKAFSTWMAGGGIRGGTVYGATDELGAAAVTDKVHVHDLHATILALLGFDHKALTYRYNGRDFRLTDNFGQVVQGVMA